MPTRLRHEHGVTLVEAAVVIATTALLASVLAPSLGQYVDQARQARARQDITTIGDAVNEFITDNAEHQFLINASNGTLAEEPPTRADANRVNLLVSDGDIPVLATAVSTESFWTGVVTGTTVDTLSNHLAENAPGETSGSRYRNPTDITIPFPGGNNIDFSRTESSGLNAPYAWRGAYLRSPVRSDPWGNRYAVNVAFLDPAPTAVVSNITAGFGVGTYPTLDVFVLSAGPDEEIDTRSAQDGAVPGDDDFIYLVSTNAK
jgi:type II secretory pathway pseudopilin PulG